MEAAASRVHFGGRHLSPGSCGLPPAEAVASLPPTRTLSDPSSFQMPQSSWWQRLALTDSPQEFLVGSLPCHQIALLNQSGLESGEGKVGRQGARRGKEKHLCWALKHTREPRSPCREICRGERCLMQPGQMRIVQAIRTD